MHDFHYQHITKPEQLDDLGELSARFEDHQFSYSLSDIANFKRQLTEPHALQMIVTDAEGKVVGFVAAAETIFPNSLFISELLVSQAAQGQGIGSALVQRCIDFALAEGLEGVYTETEAWNVPAQKLYEKCGFTTVDNPDWKGGPTYHYNCHLVQKETKKPGTEA